MNRPSHQEQSRIFLAQASEEFRKGDLRQASEKGWGAASQIVKAAADARGWEHHRHPILFKVVRQVAEEAGDREMRLMFDAAGELHSNFYDGHLDAEDVRVRLSDVADFIDRMDAILTAN